MEVLSFIISYSLLNFFMWELYTTFTQSQSLYLKEDETELSKEDKQKKEALYDGIKPECLKISLFIRCYNVFFVIRLCLLSFFIFNLQYLQFLQIIIPLTIQVYFTVMTILFLKKHKFIEHNFTSVVTIIQEVSLTLIILLIFFVYIDNI